MRAAAILGLGSSPNALKPFQDAYRGEWLMGLPANTEDADVILIFGGDGTVHRHLSQLVRLQLPVLVVPCGSGNDFARALGVPRVKDSLAVWRTFVLGSSNPRKIDLGVIRSLNAGGAPAPRSHHYFCCVAGIGVDTEVARRANRLPRWMRGHGGYVLCLPSALLRFVPQNIDIEIAGGKEPGEYASRSHKPLMLAAFANTPSFGGGMRVAPKARMDDGKLDVCLVSEISRLKLLSWFPTVYQGKHLELREVEYFQAERVRVRSEIPTEVYADGEPVASTPVEIGVVSGALPVIARDDDCAASHATVI